MPLMRLTPLLLALTATTVRAEHTIELQVPTGGQSAFSTDPASARRQLEKTPGGVAVVTRDSYDQGRASTLSDALRLAPGVFAADRFGAEEGRIAIRGSGLQRTFHGRGLMLLQDGVPLNLADGSFDMQAVEPLATRYIEVERGANALRFGAGTLGGAINFISPTGRDRQPLTLRAEVGSFGHNRQQISGGLQEGRLDAFASLTRNAQDGFRDHAAQESYRLFSNVGVQVNDRLESRFYLTAVQTDSELPGSLSWADLKNTPRKANPDSLARDSKRDFTLFRLANRTALRHADGSQTEFLAFAASKSLFHPLTNGSGLIEQDNRDVGTGIRHARETRWFGLPQAHVVGATYRTGVNDDQSSNYALAQTPGNSAVIGHAPGSLRALDTQRADNLDLYAQSSWRFSPAWTVIGGAQWTDASRRRTDLCGTGASTVCFRGQANGTASTTANPGPSYDFDYQRLSPRLGVIHQVTPSHQLYANVSGSFEPPSFSETVFSSSFLPNRAQRARTFEGGARGQQRVGEATVAWDLSVYRAMVQDELLGITLPGNLSGTLNTDRTLHQGIEAGLRAESHQWRAAASYLYNDFRFKQSGDDGIARNNRIAGIPDQVFAGEVQARLPGQLWVGPTLRAASRSWVDHANTLDAPGYAVFGLKVSQRLGNGLTWFVEGRNLGDQRFAATTGVIRRAVGNDVQFLPGEGRALYAGVSKSF